MSWIEKGQLASFEKQPLAGLFFLDGDAIAREVGRDWTAGQKYPRIAFPSGLKFDLWEGSESPIVHLFGELDLILRSTRDEAFKHAFDIGEQCGYLAAPLGEDQLELISYEDHLVVTYDNEKQMMVNVEQVKRRAEPSLPEGRFPLGRVVATPGALDSLQDADHNPLELLDRHVSGDWGDLSEEDRQENELSIEKDYRILSAYVLDTGVKVWVITEADRSVTTILLPSEY